MILIFQKCKERYLSTYFEHWSETECKGPQGPWTAPVGLKRGWLGSEAWLPEVRRKQGGRREGSQWGCIRVKGR
jgi:hypothetical protein